MTEADWLAATNPTPMLEFVKGKVSDRKLRLFAVAGCRRLTRHFKDQRSLEMIDVSERYADGGVNPAELEIAFDAAAEAQDAVHWEGGGATEQSSAEAVLGLRDGLDLQQVIGGATEAVGAAHAAEAWERIHAVPGRHWSETDKEDKEAYKAGERAELTAQAALLMDIFGNPFRPIAADSSWLTSTVVALAEGIYQNRAFDRMPILADALQDAGCSDEDILTHCRSGGPHVRGCWVVDLLTGRK